MRVSRGIVLTEILGYPRYVRGPWCLLSGAYKLAAINTVIALWKKFDVSRAVDIGAGIGGWSLAAIRSWGDVEIHAFEPNPDNRRDLIKNVEHLNVHIWPFAAMNETGKMTLSLPGEDLENMGKGSLVQKGVPIFEVDVVRVDDILPDFCPDFVKVDVEGAEPEALLGAEKMLRRSKPVMFVETTRTGRQTSQILRGLGYTHCRRTGNDHLFIHPDSPRTNIDRWSAI